MPQLADSVEIMQGAGFNSRVLSIVLAPGRHRRRLRCRLRLGGTNMLRPRAGPLARAAVTAEILPPGVTWVTGCDRRHCAQLPAMTLFITCGRRHPPSIFGEVLAFNKAPGRRIGLPMDRWRSEPRLREGRHQ
jgi:hypothetical protein